MERREHTADELRQAVSRQLGVPVRLAVTNNRRSMLSFRWSRAGLALRVHRMFVQGGPPVWRSVATFCRHPDGDRREVINRFIAEHQAQIDRANIARTRLLVLETEGRHWNLAALMDDLNRRHFKRQCDARITWGKSNHQRKRSGLQLGSYDPETNLIRIHPALDVPWVPRYVMESLLYHEMLHWLFRPRQAGARRVVHGKAFRAAEVAHPYFDRAQKWVQTNLDRLLRGT